MTICFAVSVVILTYDVLILYTLQAKNSLCIRAGCSRRRNEVVHRREGSFIRELFYLSVIFLNSEKFNE